MSDSVPEEEIGLPKATVYKLVSEALPADVSVGKDAKDIIVECCLEWLKLMSTQSNVICEESPKKTISPEHVIEALRQLGFEQFIPAVEQSEADFRETQKARQRAAPDTNGMTQEELLALQERLFASSQARMEAGQ